MIRWLLCRARGPRSVDRRRRHRSLLSLVPLACPLLWTFQALMSMVQIETPPGTIMEPAAKVVAAAHRIMIAPAVMMTTQVVTVATIRPSTPCFLTTHGTILIQLWCLEINGSRGTANQLLSCSLRWIHGRCVNCDLSAFGGSR
jgi:hypothetical protein